MTFRHTEQRMRGKIESRKGKFYMEEKAMQRGVSVDATWSVGKDGERGRGLPYGEEEIMSRIF